MTILRPYATLLRATGWEDSTSARATVFGTAVLGTLVIPYALVGGHFLRLLVFTILFVAGALLAYRYLGWSAVVRGNVIQIRSGLIHRSFELSEIRGVRVLVGRRLGRAVRLAELVDAEGNRLVLLDPAGEVDRWRAMLSMSKQAPRLELPHRGSAVANADSVPQPAPPRAREA